MPVYIMCLPVVVVPLNLAWHIYHYKERVNTRTIEISIREPVGNIDDIKSFKISDMFSVICFNSRTYGKRV
jgi:hypothetical protein